MHTPQYWHFIKLKKMSLLKDLDIRQQKKALKNMSSVEEMVFKRTYLFASVVPCP
jgi:hypothetical protein|tara:strand:- start:4290 stop:4454 length:165 start_codon:yes stop_codon:yes gene_type:complete